MQTRLCLVQFASHECEPGDYANYSDCGENEGLRPRRAAATESSFRLSRRYATRIFVGLYSA